MGRHTPMIAVTEKTAASMLDMKPAEFRRLVDLGALPSPHRIAGELKRWRVADLEAIINGSAIDDEFET